jgi:hypothetical protein
VGHRYAPMGAGRLAQPANPMWDSAASAFPVRSQLPFELVCPSSKRYAVRTLPPPVLPAHGSARIAAALWSSSISSRRNRCFGNVQGGRASLTLHSTHSSSNCSLAAAGKPEVCPAGAGRPKARHNSARDAMLFLIIRVSPMPNGIFRAIDVHKFVTPEVPWSIERP